MGVRFLATCMSAYAVALILQVENFALALLVFDALIGVFLLGVLANNLFHHSDNKRIFKLWLLDAGYIAVMFTILTLILYTAG